MTSKKPHITGNVCGLGMDPEFFFFDSKRRVVESSMVLGGKKLAVSAGDVDSDGVQAELHIKSDYITSCRANLSNYIQAVMRALRDHLQNMEGIQVGVVNSVLIPPGQFSKMLPESKRLGCLPSYNIYGFKPLGVDGEKYRRRSGGGHIHISLTNDDRRVRDDHGKPTEHAVELVKLLDFIVGNTCVLVDRDPANALRRRVYGRAGEFRLPKWGLEYRTLSNFWLKHYQLFSMAFGLTKLAYSVYQSDPQIKQAVFDRIDMRRIQKAINSNDANLAWRNFEDLAWMLKEFGSYSAVDTGHPKFMQEYYQIWQRNREDPRLPRIYMNSVVYGVPPDAIDEFVYFAQKVQSDGLGYWFKEINDPLEHWCNKPEGHTMGFENFLYRYVGSQRCKDPDVQLDEKKKELMAQWAGLVDEVGRAK